jgi:hypothetical protein
MIVGVLWVLLVAAAAMCAFGPVHRSDLPRHWSGDFFLTTVLGPLAVFHWPYPAVRLSSWDYVASVGFAVLVAGSSLLQAIRPKKWTLCILIALLALWLLLGLSVTYAWV